MCGIAGLFQFGGPNGGSVVDTMLSTMVHRGPDAGGAWTDARGRCVLGHRRLSIIDTSDAGRQPMANASGRWVITFNGEIYNFAEVRDALAAAGVHVRGRTDTEVLLESIALWGLDALQKLDGMFAFAAFDTASGELLLARDPFGEKPLYYTELPGGGLAFASELQALQQVPGFDATVSVDAMAEVLMFQYIGAPRTIYASVRKLPPGHWLSVRAGEPPRLGRYYEFRPGSSGFDHRPLADLADELEDILARSIRRRLIADVPLGAFLSGGVDSSTVCALVRRKLGLPLKTFSIGFHDAPESEHEAARAFAAHLGTEHHDQILTPHTSEFLLGIGRLLDEPNADSSCMPTYLLSAFAREQVTVALSGDGGDEMFAGYGRYFLTLDEHAAGRGNPGRSYYSDRILVSTEKHIEELFGAVPSGLAAHLAELRGEIDLSSAPLFCRLRKTDVDNYMPGAVLPKVDRMSMQHSLEVRTPFLNVELARFAEKLPLDVLYRNGRGKLLLREIAYRYLPRDLIDAPKKGFGIPMSRWGREPLLQVASSLLENDDSRLRDALGSAAIDRFMKRQRRMGGFSTYQVWSIAMLESWLRHHPADLSAITKERLSAANSLNEAFSARPLGEKLFVVRRDVRSPGSSGGIDEASESSPTMDETLRLALLAPPGTAGSDANLGSDRPITLPVSGAAQPSQHDQHRLRDAVLLFPDREEAASVDCNTLSACQRAGVSHLFLVHPYRYDGTVVHAFLRRRHFFRRLMDVFALYRRRVEKLGFRWSPPRDSKAYEPAPLSHVTDEADVELSDRYMVYQGLRQLPPLPASHDDIAAKGAGRYSVWSQRCIFSRAEPTGLADFPFFWMVEKTPETTKHLDVVPALMRAERKSSSNRWLSRLEAEIALHRATDQPRELKKGDRVVVLTHALPAGGAERQWCYLAHGLKLAGYDVRFAVIEALGDVNAHYLPWLEQHGVPVDEVAKMSVAQILRHIPRSPLLFPNFNPFDLALERLAAYLCAVRPEVVYAQLDSVNLVAGVAVHLANVPTAVLSFRNYNPTRFSYLNNDWFLPIYKALARSRRIRWSGNSTAGNADYADWIGLDREQVTYIPNAIDPDTHTNPSEETLQHLRSEFDLDAETPVVLGIFRLSEEKRPLDFVDAVAQVASRVHGVRAFIVGIGPMESAVRELIANRGLEGRVHLLGLRSDVAALMALSSVLLLTSSHEGTPNVVMEAQLLGLPVVATRCGGVTDLVEHGTTGYVCDVGDVAALADCTIKILENGDSVENLVAAARRRMLREFSVELLAQRHVQLLRAENPEKADAVPHASRVT